MQRYGRPQASKGLPRQQRISCPGQGDIGCILAPRECSGRTLVAPCLWTALTRPRPSEPDLVIEALNRFVGGVCRSGQACLS
jgi:hypothetical protein